MDGLQTDARVSAYLAEVHREVAAIDPAQAEGIVAELAEHLEMAAADAQRDGVPFDVDGALSALGDAAVIAAAVEPTMMDVGPLEVRPSGWTRAFGAPAIAAVTLILIATGMFVSPFVSIVGLILLWISPRWTIADKLVATIASPMVILIGLPALQLVSIPIAWSIAVVAPVFVALYLLLRMRSRGRRLLQVPRSAPYARPRRGVAGMVDRWPAAIVATIAAPLAVVVVVAPSIMMRSWGGLPVTGSIAGVILAIGVAILSSSRGWSMAERVIGVIATFATAAALAIVVHTVMGAVSVMQICGSAGCSDLPPRLPDAAAILDPIARYVVPVATFAAVWAAARFRSARHGDLGLTQGWVPVVAAALTLLGAAVVPAVVMMSAGSVLAAFASAVAIGAWSVGAVLVLRSSGWADVDRMLATIPIPVVAFFALLFLARSAEPVLPGVGPYADLQRAAAEIAPTLGLLSTLIQIAVAIRLLVAFTSSPGRR